MKKKGFGILRFAGMAAAVMLLTGLLVKGCNYLLTDDTQSYTRLTMHELYETAGREKEIDSLFLGSSHCFRAYDPMQFEELTGKNAFNLGSSAQNYDTSYYLLKEALRLCDIRTVYLDMHYKFLFIDKKDRDLVQANIISDYMRFSPNKLEFLLTTSEAKEYTNRFFEVFAKQAGISSDNLRGKGVYKPFLSVQEKLAGAWGLGVSSRSVGKEADRRLQKLCPGSSGTGVLCRQRLCLVGRGT